MRSLLEAESLPELAVTLPDESNVLRWRVEMSVPAGCALRDEVEAHAAAFHVRPTVELEVSFGADFPSSPPFVRVVAPRFAFHTGHVTVGGSICMELLTSSGWRSEYTVEAALLMVRAQAAPSHGGEGVRLFTAQRVSRCGKPSSTAAAGSIGQGRTSPTTRRRRGRLSPASRRNTAGGPDLDWRRGPAVRPMLRSAGHIHPGHRARAAPKAPPGGYKRCSRGLRHRVTAVASRQTRDG